MRNCSRPEKKSRNCEIDEQRLRAISAQASVALENAKLFEDVLNMKNYTENMLESMSNGILSLNADKRIVKCNAAALRILHQDELETLIEKPITELFAENNPWILDSIDRTTRTRRRSQC